VSIYVSYSDESSVRDGAGQFIIAGVVADERYWPKFSRRWAREILDAPPKIPYVHMTDFRSKEWRFRHGLCWEQQIQKVKQAVKIICEEKAVGVFLGSMPEARWTAFKVRAESEGVNIAKNKGFADYPCFTTYAAAVLNQVAFDISDLRKVNFIVSRKQNVSHHLRNDVKTAMDRYFESDHPELAKIFGDIVPLTMEDHPPLQAADVLCWHMNRAYAVGLENEEIDSSNIQALVQKPIVGLELEEALIAKMEENLLREIRENKNEQDEG
jgi:hypothetical protein